MLRSERNREGRRKQPVRFLNARVKDSKLFEEEKEEKEFINYVFTRGFKLSNGRFIRSATLDRLFDSTVNFRLHTYTRYTTLF